MKTIQILMYHRICADDHPVTSRYVIRRSVFRKQMQYLAARGFSTPSLRTILDGQTANPPAGKKPVLITFDDGYLDNYDNAFPVLREFGFRCTIFVVTDFSRRTNWWDKSDVYGEAQLLDPEHIAEMASAGIEFGSHSFSHQSLPRLTERELREELKKGKSILQQIIYQPFTAMAYPYGDVDEGVKNAVRDTGYDCAFAAHTGPFHYASDLYEIRRIPVSDRAGTLYLWYKLSGIDHTLRWFLWFLKRFLGFPSRYHA